MFKIVEIDLDEAIVVRSTNDRFNQKRIIVMSDNPDPKKAGDETFKTKDIFKKYGAAWDKEDKHWFWNDRFKSADEVAKLANNAVRDANNLLKSDTAHKEITKYDDIESLGKAKDYVETVKGAYEFVRTKSGKATLELIENYIDQLSNELGDEKLLNDIAEFNKAAKNYILDTGRYSYSMGNIFLIWLQSMGSGAKEFGSIPYWLGRGYQPIQNAKKIYILKPGNTGGLESNVKKIIKDYPNSPMEYAKENTNFKITDRNNPIPKERYNAFWNWAKTKGYVKTTFTNKFNEVAIYDNLNVEPIQGREQINEPEAPKWFNDDDSEDDKSAVMIEALKRFAIDNNITITQTDDLGGARGVSKGGHIELLTGSLGAGLLSTFIHELAHELLHQEKNKGIARGALYIDRGTLTREERELHAEAVAYTVLKTYDFPVSHSVNYLALWKQNRDKVKKYQKIIRDASMFIIQQIEKYAPSVSDKENMDDINNTLNELKVIMKDFNKIIL